VARPENVARVEYLREMMAKSEAAVLVDYRGLKVADMVKLRREVRGAGGELCVVKNTLFRLALQGTDAEPLTAQVVGPVGVVFCAEDVCGPAKALLTFAEAAPALKVQAAWADGRVYEGAQVKARSALPGRKELLGQLAGVLNAPIAGLACGLNGIIGRLARALSQVAEKSGAAA